MTKSHQKNSAFALGMGREKVHNVVIKEGEPRSAKSLGVRRQVQFSSEKTGLKLGRSISPIAKSAPELILNRPERKRRHWHPLEVPALIPNARLPCENCLP